MYISKLIDANQDNKKLLDQIEKAAREWARGHLNKDYSDGYQDYKLEIRKGSDGVAITVWGLTKPKRKNSKPKWEEMGTTGSFLVRDILSNSYYGLKGKVHYRKDWSTFRVYVGAED